MVHALEYLTERALSDLLDYLEAEPYMVILTDAVVPVGIVVPVVNDSLGLGRMNFMLVTRQIVDLLELCNFLLLQVGQELTVVFNSLCG